ncbi:MAG: stage III sporulation protein AF [Bacillota bacterium]|nr:stage III sporulation protein AF [Bacillota bacterium]
MATVETLVRDMAALVLLGSIGELLIPASELGKYLRLVMGLLLILLVMTPLLGLLSEQELSIDGLFAAINADDNSAAYIADGERLRSSLSEQALDDYQRQLAAQAAALALGVDGVAAARAEAVCASDGSIERLTLYISWTEHSEQAEQRLRAQLGGYYGLQAQQLLINEAGGSEDDG